MKRRHPPLLKERAVKEWHRELSAESEVTASEYLRRLNSLSHAAGLKPSEMVEKCREEGAQRFVAEVMKKLEFPQAARLVQVSCRASETSKPCGTTCGRRQDPG